MLGDAVLIARKDLRIERRSRVVLSQVVPFAILVLVLFAFALNADRQALADFTPGLFWIAVLFSALLTIQRSTAVEGIDGTADSLRLSGIDPASIFLGKAMAVGAQLLVLEALLLLGVFVFYEAGLGGEATASDVALLALTAVVTAIGVSAAGTLYGALTVGVRGQETLLPILLLPVLAPVLIGATRAFDDAFGSAAVNGWAWLALLALFAVVYVVFGLLAYGILMEES